MSNETKGFLTAIIITLIIAVSIYNIAVMFTTDGAIRSGCYVETSPFSTTIDCSPGDRNE